MTPMHDAAPWYKQSWPWFLIFFPATAVVAGLITLWIAISSFDGFVVDDFQKEGQSLDQSRARTDKAASLGLSAEAFINGNQITLQLDSSVNSTLPEKIIVTLAHPTRGELDQVLFLVARDGAFSSPIQPVSAGRWMIQVEDEFRSWRMNGTTELPTEKGIRIVPYGS